MVGAKETKQLALIVRLDTNSHDYALYQSDTCRVALHFEHADGHVVCTATRGAAQRRAVLGLTDLQQAAHAVPSILQTTKALGPHEHITRIALRLAVPSSLFLQDRLLDNVALEQLHNLLVPAPQLLSEISILQQRFPQIPVYGISDTAFHASKPDKAWNYGLPLHDADRLDIKRFGYQGLSAAAAVHALRKAKKLPPKMILCHIADTTSVMAIHHGRSVDTTTGYSPLDGVITATGSGSLDTTAVRSLQKGLHLNDADILEYLSTKSGLLGMSSISADSRELIKREPHDHNAKLAVHTYVYSLQKAIGQMAAALGGVDGLVFTGRVGEQSAAIRKRVVGGLGFLRLTLNQHANQACTKPTALAHLHTQRSKPILVVPTNEAATMANHVQTIEHTP